MGITMLLVLFILMIAFFATALVIYNLQKNSTDSPVELQTQILQEFNKTGKPPQ